MSKGDRLKFPPRLGEKYREALVTQKEFAPESERSQYKYHLEALDELEGAINKGADIKTISKLLRSERHNFGWSYLSGQAGQKVETTYHEFATEIEKQIIRAKGFDWYYNGGRKMETKLAPDFTLRDGQGNEWKLSNHRGKTVVLLFYPGDNTPVCTAQLCSVRDHWSEYQATGAEVVGISTDTVESHKGFAEKNQLPLRLLSDTDGEVSAKYGMKSWLPGRSARGVVVINKEGKIAYHKVQPLSLFRPKDDEVLSAIARADQI